MVILQLLLSRYLQEDHWWTHPESSPIFISTINMIGFLKNQASNYWPWTPVVFHEHSWKTIHGSYKINLKVRLRIISFSIIKEENTTLLHFARVSSSSIKRLPFEQDDVLQGGRLDKILFLFFVCQEILTDTRCLAVFLIPL